MKMMIRTLLALAVLAAVPCFALTDDGPRSSGYNYIRVCRPVADATLRRPIPPGQHDADEAAINAAYDAAVNADECLDWTSGAMEGLILNEKTAEYYGHRFYNIDSITIGQLMRSTLSYIDRHPEQMNWPTIYLMNNAMIEAFPAQTARQP